MSLSDLNEMCSKWNNSSDNFASIIEASCSTLGLYRHELASEFEVAESTVSRWANGIAKPHPRMQKVIIASILKRVSRLLKSQGGSSNSSSGGNYPMSAASR